MKIFHTQLKGILDKLANEEESLEDAARILAQSIIGDGTVYWHGEKEMKGMTLQACEGADKIPDSVLLNEPFADLSSLDSLVVASAQYSENVKSLIRQAKNEGAAVIGIGSEPDFKVEKDDFDVYFTTHVTKGLVPLESGERTGHPHLLVSLYIYYGLYFAVSEILEEHME